MWIPYVKFDKQKTDIAQHEFKYYFNHSRNLTNLNIRKTAGQDYQVNQSIDLRNCYKIVILFCSAPISTPPEADKTRKA